jgi:uncharacterized membrane protein
MGQEIVFDQTTQSSKNFAWWLYVFHAISFVFSLGLFSFIPLILNYVKRQDALGTFVYSHHSWQIRSFLWYLFWVVVGGVLAATIILFPLAILVWTGAWIWKAYRLIKGFIDLDNNKPMPM